jgi:hypothetical protein
MRIGIISKREHCKTHAPALRGEGHKVYVLGGNPSKIAKKLDVLVLRTDSCGHGASEVAFKWSKRTGLPLIVENGLSGIRRQMSELFPKSKSHFQKAWNLLKTQRPEDTERQRKEALRAMGANDTVISLIANEVLEKDTENVNMKRTNYPKTRGPIPNVPWSKVFTEEKLRSAFDRSQTFLETLQDNDIDSLVQCFQKCVEDPSIDMKSILMEKTTAFSSGRKSVFAAKPNAYAMLLATSLPEDWRGPKAALNRTYQSLTGKAMDTRLPNAVFWFLGRPDFPGIQKADPNPEPVSAPSNELSASLEAPPAIGAQEAFEGDVNPQALAKEVDECTRVVLDLMTDVDEVRNSVAENAGLIQEIFERMGEVEKKLTQILKNEAERPLSVGEPSTGMGALEDIRQALSNAGFKGTLTLDID